MPLFPMAGFALVVSICLFHRLVLKGISHLVLQVLSDPEQRIVYDEINGFAPTSANPFLISHQERDHAFVDEFSCIGKSLALIDRLLN